MLNTKVAPAPSPAKTHLSALRTAIRNSQVFNNPKAAGSSRAHITRSSAETPLAATMHLLLRLSSLLISLISLLPLSTATALTYKLAPSEKACFFTYVEQKNAKVAFYFAVCLFALPTLSSHILSSQCGLRARSQFPKP